MLTTLVIMHGRLQLMTTLFVAWTVITALLHASTLADGRRMSKRHYKVVDRHSSSDRANTSDEVLVLSEQRTSEVDLTTSPGLFVPNATSIQQAVRRNIIRGANGRTSVSLPHFDYIKKELCKSEPLRQIVREAGCISVPIQNRFCYGQCNSFFIPKNTKRRSRGFVEKSAFKSCSFCRPKRADWIAVQLHCPQKSVPFKIKKIQIIKECSCTALNLT